VLIKKQYLILFNDQLDAQFFFVYIYFNSVHVSNLQVLIIRRFNCINKIPGISHSMWATVRYACLDVSVQTCIPGGHLQRMTCTRYLIDIIESPDDEHLNVRNMYRIEINIYKKEMCVKLVIK